ncbi:hypothetical protein [Pantoea brenneri]|uniref:hypothetical protein n=1 Tax=Pantoea brenneri TaxID=472694 RepID=UPI002899EB1E|nr:hypothetical protein [Pantoea brenneri]
MKKSACSELYGKIIHARTILPARNIALYEVDFENGRTAVLRVSTTFPLQEGDTIERINDVWRSGQHVITPAPFEFVEKRESDRYFIEYER